MPPTPTRCRAASCAATKQARWAETFWWNSGSAPLSYLLTCTRRLAKLMMCENRTEVRCPRVILAAMIAAAAFGSRRSGSLANGSVGRGLLGGIREAWPALAPPDDCILLSCPARAGHLCLMAGITL